MKINFIFLILIGNAVLCRVQTTLADLKQELKYAENIQNKKWQITITGSSVESSRLDSVCFAIPSYSKIKRDAYDSLEKRMRKFRSFLRDQLMICNTDQSIQSTVKSMFLNKKKVWFFEKTALVLVEPQYLQDAIGYFKKKGIIQVTCEQKLRVESAHLKPRISVLKALQSAKDQLRKFIAQYPYLQVDQIKGCNIKNIGNWEAVFQQDTNEYQQDWQIGNENENEIMTELQGDLVMDVVFQLKYDDDQQKMRKQQDQQDQQF